MVEERKKKGCLRLLFRWTAQFVVLVGLFLICAYLFVFWSALHNYYSLFPKQAAAWEAIRVQRQEVSLDDGWTEYRGVCHSHSEISHDSEVTFPEILQAAKIADIDFICMTDHCVEGKADFSWGWSGVHDGVLFVQGFEMDYGFMPWGLPKDTVLDRNENPEVLAKQIHEKGGVLFFAHSEEDRHWDLPELNGMEIYNIHTDVKDEGDTDVYLRERAPDFITSLRRYPDQTMRLLFDRQTAILKKWDELNKTRRIVGIAASDAHQNNGFRGSMTEDGKFLLRMTSPDDGKAFELNFFTRALLWLFFGPLEPGRQLFRVDLDPYERSLRYVNTHVLMNELTEPALIDALRAGRAFIAFDMIADARGFVYLAEADGARAVMGEEIALRDGLTLRAASPYPCRFTLMKDGAQAAQGEGRTFAHAVAETGNYRIEAEFEIAGEWTPWVYTNPIRVVGSTTAPVQG